MKKQKIAIVVLLLCCGIVMGNDIKVKASTGVKTNRMRIDGNFEDWKDIPLTSIGYGGNNGEAVHKGALYIENDTLYGYFKMHDIYGAQMMVNMMNLTVNGRILQLITSTKNSDNQITWGNIYDFPVGVTKDLGIFTNDGGKNYFGEGAFRVYDASHEPGDEFEFAISLDKLSKVMGIEVESMAEFSIGNPNIGSQVVTITGTPTGAMLGIGLSLTAVAIWMFSKRKKIVERSNC